MLGGYRSGKKEAALSQSNNNNKTITNRHVLGAAPRGAAQGDDRTPGAVVRHLGGFRLFRLFRLQASDCKSAPLRRACLHDGTRGARGARGAKLRNRVSRDSARLSDAVHKGIQRHA